LDVEPVYQSESFPESPAIHVAVLPDVDPVAFRWVRVGAEEEGVPCREVPMQMQQELPVQAESRVFGWDDPRVAASAAAQESRLGVGVAAGGGRVVLHEAHMPVECPVWESPLTGDLRQACRLAGCNAGRLVKRMPLRFEYEEIPVTELGSRAGRFRVVGGRAGVTPAAAPEPEGASHVTEIQADAAHLAAIVASIVRSLQERGIV
jgi:hypothetical protein